MTKIEIILNNEFTLDVTEDVIIPLTYQIDDIRNPSTANASFSKSVKLPSTKNNNKVLGNLFDINSDFTIFNPNIKTDAIIIVNGSPILEGYFQLTSIDRDFSTDGEGNNFTYSTVFFENTVNVFAPLKGKFLINNIDPNDDISLSGFNHNLNITNISGAWTNDWDDGYQYPLSLPSDGSTNYQVAEFRPAIYHKKLVEVMFSDLGYEIGGSFWDNNTDYEKEIIPFSGLDEVDSELIATDLDTLAVEATMSGFTAFPVFKPQEEYGISTPVMPEFEIPFPNEVNDPTNQYNPVTNTLTIGKDGTYDLNVDMNGGLTLEFYNGFTLAPHQSNVRVNYFPYPNIVRNPWSTNQSLENTTQEPPKGSWTIFAKVKTGINPFLQRGGEKTVLLPIYRKTNDLYGPANSFRSTLAFDIDLTVLSNYDFIAGDEVKLFLKFRAKSDSSVGIPAYVASNLNGSPSATPLTRYNNFTSFQKYTFTWSQGSSFNLVGLDTSAAGATVNVSNSIPRGFKKEDLFVDIIRRYNLYVRTDKDNPNKILLDSRDDFYSAGDTLDWTHKKDYDNNDKIELLPNLQKKEMLFTYTEGSDEFNSTYKASTQGDIYGQKKIEFVNDFTDGTETIKSPFISTPLVYENKQKKYMILPAMYGNNEKKQKPRLLYWGGLKDMRGEARWRLQQDTNTQTTYTSYPYAGHIDDPLNPTLDINFGPIANLFDVPSAVNAPNNLYDRYWANYVNFVSEGRMLTAKFDLNETDIFRIKDNLNVKIFIKDTYYHINKIKDYNPTSNGLTTVELLKIN